MRNIFKCENCRSTQIPTPRLILGVAFIKCDKCGHETNEFQQVMAAANAWVENAYPQIIPPKLTLQIWNGEVCDENFTPLYPEQIEKELTQHLRDCHACQIEQYCELPGQSEWADLDSQRFFSWQVDPFRKLIWIENQDFSLTEGIQEISTRAEAITRDLGSRTLEVYLYGGAA